MTGLPDALAAWAAGLGGAAGTAAVAAPGGRAAASAAGRRAASDALARLGGPALGDDRHDDGRPVWPDGWTGSISHAGEVAVAVVARATDVDALGVDVEGRGGLPLADAAVVLDDDELAWAEASPAPDEAATLLWSAKEAAFKAWSEATRGALGPVDPRRHLHVEAHVDGAGTAVLVAARHELAAVVAARASGRAWWSGALVLVAVALEAQPVTRRAGAGR